MSPPPTKHPLRLIRPAIIEFRYLNPKIYHRQVRLFEHALRAKPGTTVSTDTSYTFSVGLVPKGKKSEDMAFRLLLLRPKQIGATRTIVYWEVPESQNIMAVDSLKLAIDSLKSAGFAVVEHPVQVGKSTQAIVKDTLNADADAAIMPNTGTGRLVGLVVNPPYPTVAKEKKYVYGVAPDSIIQENQRTGPAAPSPSYWLWLGLLVCAVAGFFVGRFWRK